MKGHLDERTTPLLGPLKKGNLKINVSISTSEVRPLLLHWKCDFCSCLYHENKIIITKNYYKRNYFLLHGAGWMRDNIS